MNTEKQNYTSANTSINAKKLPSIYSMKRVVNAITGKSVIDIGGGKYDNAIEYCKTIGCELSVYDKYNRTETHNNKVLEKSYDIAIISNVLNVIDSQKERENVLKLASGKADTIFITVYEGDGSNVGKVTKNDCYQLNRKTVDYIQEITTSLPWHNVSRYGRLIVCKRAMF